MNILSIAAECAPFAKMGGLADVVASLTRQWHATGHTATIILPKYASVDVERYALEETDLVVGVPVSSWTEYARVWRAKLPGSEADVFFLDNADYFHRDGIYGDPHGYADNDRRFTFLCRAACELACMLAVPVDIIHAHDYHAALAIPFVQVHYRRHPVFAHTASVYTIHNMAFQGQSDPRRILEFASLRPDNFRGSWFEHDGVVNLMKTGIMFADKITTVSPTYAQEIRWTRNGEGMQDYLGMRSADLVGVLNGADYSEWNPETDSYLPSTYSLSVLPEKAAVKNAVLRHSLPEHDDTPDLPLFGMVSRLTAQKGIDLLESVLEPLLRTGRMRFMLLGSGDPAMERYFRHLGSRYPSRALIRIGYDHALSHSIIAASDFLLVPSLFEPCGLTQLYAMRYGTVPVVRATGGLRDTVHEYDPHTATGTGFLFERYTAADFQDAVMRALSVYREEPHWTALRTNGMTEDHSSERCAERYVSVFTWAMERRRTIHS
ncbi:MAG: glycogen synthase [Candidatus Kapaibacterium sp.]